MKQPFLPTHHCASFTRAAGGPGSISEQIAESDVDVVLGGGSKHFDMPAEGMDVSVTELAQNNGFHIARSVEEMSTAPADKKLLGLFSPSTMPVRLQGENGREAEEPKPSWSNKVNKYLGSVKHPEVMNCEPNPEFEGMPTMKQMTDVALDRLANDQGFFLMVESASIDKKSHERKPCGSIGELEQLTETLDSALKFAAENKNTLVLVTADHAQAAQLIPSESLFARFPIPVYSPGKVARIRTPEGAVLSVNYATNNFSMEEHTGAHVPVYANEEGQGRVPTMLTQPELFTIIREYLIEE